MGINVRLKDGSIKKYEREVSVLDVCKDISEGLLRNATAAEVNGEVVDLRYIIDKDCDLNILTFENSLEGKKAYWHTSAHILAQAVKRLFPEAKFAIGPAINEGFYYDFDKENSFTQEEVEKIEEEMRKIVKENSKLERFTLSREDSIKFMEERGENYKVELIEDLPVDEEISFYKQGDFTDLCAGPHLQSTKPVKAIKITKVAGAYWRGSEKNKMLTRLYGISFPKAKELEEYLAKIEEAKKRDHRKLGKDLKLFMLLEEGPGFPFLLPKGVTLKNKLLEYWREVHEKAGYVEVETPIILNRKLWETSGHWFNYKENMYTVKIDEEDYSIKPMNCPGGMLTYKSDIHSYRELPLRVGEIGRVHRHELSGALHGLMRVRAFTQDDAHVFMLPEQIKDEIKNVANLIDEVYNTFGFKYKVELSTKPEKSMGNKEDWDMAENSLKEALDELKLDYAINEGDGAFYGPKIDFHLEDCLGRTWQCGTIQLDFQMPQRFELYYIGEDGEKHTPIMIHTVTYGSIERFMGILIEHFAGAFPVWVSPVQVRILPISEKYHEYGEQILNELKSVGLRVEIDRRAEKIGFKIREARNERVPYMLVVGEKEESNSEVSLRSRKNGDEGSVKLNDFVKRILKEVKDKEI